MPPISLSAETLETQAEPESLSPENRQSAIGNRQFDIARLLLILTLFAAPWAFGAVGPWAQTALAFSACAILFLWALGCARQGVVQLTWSPLYILLGLFFLLGVVQYSTRLTLDQSETRQALVLLGADLLFFFLAVQLFANASTATWRAFGFMVLLLGASLGLFAMLQFAAGEQRIYGQVDTPGNLLFGPYVNPNHFAGLMEMLIPVGVLSIAARSRKTSLSLLLWLGVGAAIMVAALLLSGSRGGLLALGAEIIVALGVGRRERGVGSREPGPGNRERRAGNTESDPAGPYSRFPVSYFPLRKATTRRPPPDSRFNLAAALATAVLGTVLLFTWIDPGVVAQKLSLIVEVGGPAWTEWAGFRKGVASDSLHMLRDHPAAGVGLGDFETAYPRYQSFPSDMWIDFGHNDYVQALAETGIAGGVLMLAALGMFLHLAFRGSRFGARDSRLTPDEDDRTPSPEDQKPNTDYQTPSLIRVGAALGCCGMLVHSFFDFNLHIPANAAWFAVLAGIAVTG